MTTTLMHPVSSVQTPPPSRVSVAVHLAFMRESFVILQDVLAAEEVTES